jgi:hypothetical protein
VLAEVDDIREEFVYAVDGLMLNVVDFDDKAGVKWYIAGLAPLFGLFHVLGQLFKSVPEEFFALIFCLVVVNRHVHDAGKG